MAFIVIGADRTTSVGTSSGDVIMIKSGVAVTSPLDGINGFSSNDLVVMNLGFVAGDLIGASVSSGSVVTNGDGAVLYGSAVGMWLNGTAAALNNLGTIQSRGDGLADITAAVGLNNASGAVIDNGGAILGGNFGIDLHGSTQDTTITNSGRITGVNAAITGGGTLRLENSGSIVSASGSALAMSGTDDAVRIINTGTLSGKSAAVETGSANDVLSSSGTINGNVSLGTGADRLVNSGDIVGDVDLGDGADRYVVTRGGYTSGDVSGGAGNDQLRGGREDDRLNGGDGADVLVGGAGADYLVGGADADRISGGAGEDVIIGGAGDDQLRGNAGGDIFVFADGSGADTVLDFQLLRGDVIDLSGATAIDDFADLAANHLTFVDGNAVIDLGNGDTVTLLAIDAAALTAGDFVF